MTAQLPRFPGQGGEGWSQWLEAGPAAGTSLYICAQGSLTGGRPKDPVAPWRCPMCRPGQSARLCLPAPPRRGQRQLLVKTAGFCKNTFGATVRKGARRGVSGGHPKSADSGNQGGTKECICDAHSRLKHAPLSLPLGAHVNRIPAGLKNGATETPAAAKLWAWTRQPPFPPLPPLLLSTLSVSCV